MKLDPKARENLVHWRTLFSAVVDGSATDAQEQEVKKLLQDNPAARDEYLAYIDFHATLSAPSTLAGQIPDFPLVQQRLGGLRGILRTRTGKSLLCAGGLSLLLMFVLLFSHVFPKPRYATLVRSVGSDAQIPGHFLRVGDSIGADICRLTRGAIELRYARGVQLIIEGPAQFCCRSEDTLILYKGRLSADVPPPATGFRVETPRMEVVDVGTRFGVDVSPEGVAEVHVFQGEVFAKGDTDSKAITLHSGHARRVSDEGNANSRTFRNAAFIHPRELVDLEEGLSSGQQARWQAAVKAIRTDPSLLAYFGFDQPSIQKDIHGARSVQGRFPGASAVEFAGPDDYVRFDLEGSYPELTMMTWVRLDRSPTGENSLFHTDNWETDGQVHWLVAEQCQMRFSLHRGDRDPYEGQPWGNWPESSPSALSDVGRWVHLAVTYQADRKAIRFYVNGRFDREVIDPVIRNAILGPAQIGNWNTNDPKYPNRCLSGRMDEFIILGRVMSDREIRDFYNSGSPYRVDSPRSLVADVAVQSHSDVGAFATHEATSPTHVN